MTHLPGPTESSVATARVDSRPVWRETPLRPGNDRLAGHSVPTSQGGNTVLRLCSCLDNRFGHSSARFFGAATPPRTCLHYLQQRATLGEGKHRQDSSELIQLCWDCRRPFRARRLGRWREPRLARHLKSPLCYPSAGTRLPPLPRPDFSARGAATVAMLTELTAGHGLFADTSRSQRYQLLRAGRHPAGCAGRRASALVHRAS